MANEISTYTYEGTELPFEDWSDKIHSFNDLASRQLMMLLNHQL